MFYYQFLLAITIIIICTPNDVSTHLLLISTVYLLKSSSFKTSLKERHHTDRGEREVSDVRSCRFISSIFIVGYYCNFYQYNVLIDLLSCNWVSGTLTHLKREKMMRIINEWMNECIVIMLPSNGDVKLTMFYCNYSFTICWQTLCRRFGLLISKRIKYLNMKNGGKWIIDGIFFYHR